MDSLSLQIGLFMPGSLQAECLPVPCSLLGCGSRVWRLWHSSGVSAAGKLERELREMAPARAVSGKLCLTSLRRVSHLLGSGLSPWSPGRTHLLSLAVFLCVSCSACRGREACQGCQEDMALRYLVSTGVMLVCLTSPLAPLKLRHCVCVSVSQ